MLHVLAEITAAIACASYGLYSPPIPCNGFACIVQPSDSLFIATENEGLNCACIMLPSDSLRNRKAADFCRIPQCLVHNRERVMQCACIMLPSDSLRNRRVADYHATFSNTVAVSLYSIEDIFLFQLQFNIYLLIFTTPITFCLPLLPRLLLAS